MRRDPLHAAFYFARSVQLKPNDALYSLQWNLPDIDMERAWDAREGLNRIDDQHRVSFNDIFVKVVALSLVQHPECNAWWQVNAKQGNVELD